MVAFNINDAWKDPLKEMNEQMERERQERMWRFSREERAIELKKELDKDGFIPESKDKGGFMTKKMISYSLPESVEREKKQRKSITDNRKKERKNRKKNRK